MRPLSVVTRRAGMAWLTALVMLTVALPASAQVLGPFKWQLQPYCNVVEFTATAEAGGFRLAGVDDGCGAAASPASGRATVNGDGSVTLAFVVVAADGAALHASAHLAPLALAGTWSDAGGSSGGFVPVANSPILVGTPRPFAVAGGGPIPANSVTGATVVDGTLTAADVDASSVQRRIATPCPPGQFAQQVNVEGTLSCAAVAGSAGGDITAVAAGSGLAGGGTTGDVTLAIAAGGVGATQLAAGAVTSDKLGAGAVGSAAVANGSIGAVDVNAAEIQRRISTACGAGYFLQSVNADGSAVCAADGGSGGGGGISTVVAGTGLAGGGSASSVTLSVAPQGITGALLAPGAVDTPQLAAGAVTSGQIEDGTIAGVDVNANEVQRRVTGTCGTGLFATGVDISGVLACADGGAATSVLVGSGTGTGGNTVTAAQVVAVGVDALRANAATGNTALGYRALSANTNGATNVAVGADALVISQSGDNTAVGAGALDSLTSGDGNLALGRGAGGLLGSGNDNVYLAHPGVPGDDRTIRLGMDLPQTRLFAAGIYGTTVTVGQQVYVDVNGQLGTLQSSARFKTDVADMAGESRRLLSLRPVTFRYREGMATATGERQYGLVAEEVAQVYPDLVTRDRDGRIDGVQYQKLAPMLLNEVQRQQREIEALKAQLSEVMRRLDGK